MASRVYRRWTFWAFRLILQAVLLALIAGVWWQRQEPPQYPSAYVSVRSATLWSTLALVRQQVATLDYGQRVDVLRHSQDQVEVLVDDGTRGWMDASRLMEPAVWQQAAALLQSVQTMPVQALGHTRTISNVRLGPGLDAPRIYQFRRDTPVAVFERRVVPAAGANENASGTEVPSPDAEQHMPEQRMEDWLLVLRTEASTAAPPNTALRSSSAATESSGTRDDFPIAGWVFAPFIVVVPPPPIPQYANSAGMRAVAWAVLDTVPDAGGEKPQYLVVGVRSGIAQACDFSVLRVYTWGAVRQRYETAYIENDLCGRLPIRVSHAPPGTEFRFAVIGEKSERLYRMRQTIVRRIREGPASRE